MDCSIFNEKQIVPDEKMLQIALGESYSFWDQIFRFTLNEYPKGTSEWKYPGAKYGWSFRVNDRKRVIVYLLPRDGYFMVALVFGQKAFEKVMESAVNENIKSDLSAAKPYAEGRGIRIMVQNEAILQDIYTLIRIKLSS
jgi:hypothetical protein